MRSEQSLAVRRRTVLIAVASAISAGPPTRSHAADIVRIIVGGTPGSAPDLLARRLAGAIALAMKRTVIVVNRPGAGGAIALQAIVDARPDGSTLGLATMSQLVFNAHVLHDLRSDADRDAIPVATIGSWPLVIAANP